MRAALLVETGKPLELAELPAPSATVDGVVVQTQAAGICRTDVHNWLGDWGWLGFESPVPRVLGHEMAGAVVEIGARVRSLRVGDRVTVPFHVACGECDRCRSGASNLCSQALYLGGSLPGAFAEFVAVPRADLNCIRLADGLSSETGAALGCRFMTAWHGLRDLARVAPGEWVLVTGAGGGVGLSAVSIAHAMGAQVIAVDVPEKLEATRRAGADVLLSPGDDVAEAVAETTRSGADVTVDTVAKPATVRAALLSLRSGGRHVQIGMTGAAERGEVSIPIDHVVAGELKMFGVSGNPHAHYPELLEFVAATGCDPASFIDRRIRLQEINEGLQYVRDFGATGLVMVSDFS